MLCRFIATMKNIGNLKIFVLICSICLGASVFGQSGLNNGMEYRFPLEITPSLSGNYGELRASHFHTGIDFRIGGAPGARLYAVERGYISRITVSPTGYGRALYITHPDGLTTIYGHMHLFSTKIEEYVRREQYKQESFSVNLYPDSTVFRVKRGDYIGQAGNSGSSVAPHLHFEVRNTDGQNTLNPFSALNLEIKDNIAPVFESVNFYSISNVESIPLRSRIASYPREEVGVVEVTDTFYIAVAATDRQNGTTGKLAIHRYRYFLDDEQIFSLTSDLIPSGMGRYVNSVIEYPERQRQGRNFMVKSWVEPACGLMSNIKAKSNGLFILEDDRIHKVKIELWDEHNNMAERTFNVKRRIAAAENSGSSVAVSDHRLGKDIVMPWFLSNEGRESDFSYSLAPGSLYSSVIMNLRRDTVGNYAGWRLHNDDTPLHRPIIISIKADIPESQREKSLIAIVGNSGRLSSLGGKWNGGWIEASSSSFGLYTVVLDTIAPRIVSPFKEGESLKGSRIIRIRISDNLSGIADYRVYIDDKWILAEYDAKNGRLLVSLDERVISRDKRHSISVEVTDGRGNINRLKSSFIW